jgi:hypothetical protein
VPTIRGRCEPQIAHHCEHEAAACSDAVDGRNHRLRHAQQIAEQRGQFIRVSIASARRHAPRGRAREISRIKPCGKGATGSRNNDCDHAFVSGGALHRIANLFDHLKCESVELFGPIQPNRGD